MRGEAHGCAANLRGLSRKQTRMEEYRALCGSVL